MTTPQKKAILEIGWRTVEGRTISVTVARPKTEESNKPAYSVINLYTLL